MQLEENSNERKIELVYFILSAEPIKAAESIVHVVIIPSHEGRPRGHWRRAAKMPRKGSRIMKVGTSAYRQFVERFIPRCTLEPSPWPSLQSPLLYVLYCTHLRHREIRHSQANQHAKPRHKFFGSRPNADFIHSSNHSNRCHYLLSSSCFA